MLDGLANMSLLNSRGKEEVGGFSDTVLNSTNERASASFALQACVGQMNGFLTISTREPDKSFTNNSYRLADGSALGPRTSVSTRGRWKHFLP